jgi:putative transposase
MTSTRFSDRRAPARHALDEIGNRSNLVFVTVCTKDRKPILTNNAAHELLRDVWQLAGTWLVGRYVVMPDHLHLFCAPATPDVPNVRDWIAFWKASFTRKWVCSQDKPIWQRDAWDRQLRKGDSYSAKWAYVAANPVRHGMVQRVEDWPFQGELNVLQWREPQ